MGQATADLPNTSPDAAAPPSADDLLSQLAGDEIDRLLSEADVDRPDQAHADEAEAPIAVAKVSEPVVVASPVEKESPSKEIPADAASAKENVSAQLDDLLGQLDSPKTESPATANEAKPAAKVEKAEHKPVETSAPAAAVTQTSKPADSAAAVAAEMELDKVSPAESKALTDDTQDSHGHEAESSTIDEEAPISSANVPIILKPLVWLNAPLLACSESVRRNVGKVAIVTMLNAIAVLAYVIMTRKPH